MEQAHFRANDEFGGIGFGGKAHHSRRAQGCVSHFHHLGSALGMGDEQGLGMGRPGGLDIGNGQQVMEGATAFPQVDGFIRMPGGVARQIAIGRHEQFIGGQAADHFDGVGRRAADGGQGFDRRRGVHVGHHRHFRQGGQAGLERCRRNHVGHGAAGIGPRQQDGLLGRKNRSGLGHEMDPAKNDHVCIGIGGTNAQFQGIPADVGQGLDLRRLVVVSQKNGVFFLEQLSDFSLHGRIL
ncbi:conserved hypothetical protein [Desulfosarcina cetonica]|nr:conserved hypothetical protein [Desulfosarcina cetonica]